MMIQQMLPPQKPLLYMIIPPGFLEWSSEAAHSKIFPEAKSVQGTKGKMLRIGAL